MTTLTAAALVAAAVALVFVAARVLGSNEPAAPPGRMRPKMTTQTAAALADVAAALAVVALVFVAARALGPDEPAAPPALMRCDPLEGAPGSMLCYDPNAADYGG